MPSTPPADQQRTAVATFAVIAAVAALVVATLWWVQQQDQAAGSGGSETSSTSDRASDPDDGSGGAEESDRGEGHDLDPGLGAAAEDIAAQDYPGDPMVVVISVDGLGSHWVSQATTPTIADLFADGAGTLNARTEVERTVTLPNHTGMVTGRRVAAAEGGHGVTWNETSRRKVVPGTSSVFSVIDEAGGSSAIFVGKDKFEMWGRAWPGTIDELGIFSHQTALVGTAIDDLHEHERDLTFVHLASPDSAGHEFGWGSPEYLAAVRKADSDIDRLVTAIVDDRRLSRRVVVVVTADHGGIPGTPGHAVADRPETYTIPFVVWGPGIRPGDLYALNPDYREPGTGRPGYDGPQPVRNADVANLVTDLLGLGPVPGSELDAAQDLDVE